MLRGYPWLTKLLHREVVIEGQDKVFKDVIEPLKSVSVNMILPSNKIFETLVLHNRFSMYTLPPDIFHHRGGNIIFLNALSPVYNLSSYL